VLPETRLQVTSLRENGLKTGTGRKPTFLTTVLVSRAKKPFLQKRAVSHHDFPKSVNPFPATCSGFLGFSRVCFNVAVSWHACPRSVMHRRVPPSGISLLLGHNLLSQPSVMHRRVPPSGISLLLGHNLLSQPSVMHGRVPPSGTDHDFLLCCKVFWVLFSTGRKKHQQVDFWIF